MKKGFSLAEVLLALTIVAAIAAFAIPKVLEEHKGKQAKAFAKAAAIEVASAYQQYRLDNASVTTSMTIADFWEEYGDYVSIETSGSVDDKNNQTDLTCTSTNRCYKMRNDATIWMVSSRPFGNTENTNAISFRVDPFEGYSGTTTGSEKAVQFFLYYNGRLKSRNNVDPNTYVASSSYSPGTTHDPDYWSWD